MSFYRASALLNEAAPTFPFPPAYWAWLQSAGDPRRLHALAHGDGSVMRRLVRQAARRAAPPVAWNMRVPLIVSAQDEPMTLLFLRHVLPLLEGDGPTDDNSRLIFLPEQATRVHDISPLADLKHLKVLTLSHSSVADISPLAGLPLATLDLDHTKVRDISPLEGMPLRTLSLYRLRIRDFSPLSTLRRLASLNVTACKGFNDASVIANAPLEYLDAARTPLTDISPLAGVDTLETLDVSRCPLGPDALAPLRGHLPNLELLALAGAGEISIEPLRGRRALSTLDLEGVRVRDPDAVLTLPNLEQLTVDLAFPEGVLERLDDDVLVDVVGVLGYDEYNTDINLDEREGNSKVQTLILSKDRFASQEDAEDWAKGNGFTTTKVDETGASWRIRQRPPSQFTTFRTITLTKGVKAVVGIP